MSSSLRCRYIETPVASSAGPGRFLVQLAAADGTRWTRAVSAGPPRCPAPAASRHLLTFTRISQTAPFSPDKSVGRTRNKDAGRRKRDGARNPRCTEIKWQPSINPAKMIRSRSLEGNDSEATSSRPRRPETPDRLSFEGGGAASWSLKAKGGGKQSLRKL
ncbi:hypothetical protein GWI33_005650 [Rhynchophorus ferrugineus]|uniref:Uncharacterized protein n=1 Tax=Rhynchophorus ferrugineus TaxID=354439 RepID=A0A834IH56_RHYFE|nr:hypothetical protein GWI33_005650 [Rhynchophorus ferrugineus]